MNETIPSRTGSRLHFDRICFFVHSKMKWQNLWPCLFMLNKPRERKRELYFVVSTFSCSCRCSLLLRYRWFSYCVIHRCDDKKTVSKVHNSVVQFSCWQVRISFFASLRIVWKYNSTIDICRLSRKWACCLPRNSKLPADSASRPNSAGNFSSASSLSSLF